MQIVEHRPTRDFSAVVELICMHQEPSRSNRGEVRLLLALGFADLAFSPSPQPYNFLRAARVTALESF